LLDERRRALEAAGREDERLVVGRESGAKPRLAGRARERVRQPAGVEALADRSRVAGLLPDHRRAERPQPLERVVQALPDEVLELRVAVRALAPEVLERAMPPDDAGREQHRPARPVAL